MRVKGEFVVHTDPKELNRVEWFHLHTIHMHCQLCLAFSACPHQLGLACIKNQAPLGCKLGKVGSMLGKVPLDHEGIFVAHPDGYIIGIPYQPTFAKIHHFW